MTTTPSEARYEMFDLFEQIWLTLAPVIVGYAPELRFQGVEKPGVPDPLKYWARLSTQNAVARQTAFVEDDEPGKTRREYTNKGNLFVQVFAPMSEVDGYDLGYKLAELAQGIFQNAETSSSVWFRNVRINEQPNDGKAYPFNVVVEYQFDQLN